MRFDRRFTSFLLFSFFSGRGYMYTDERADDRSQEFRHHVLRPGSYAGQHARSHVRGNKRKPQRPYLRSWLGAAETIGREAGGRTCLGEVQFRPHRNTPPTPSCAASAPHSPAQRGLRRAGVRRSRGVFTYGDYKRRTTKYLNDLFSFLSHCTWYACVRLYTGEQEPGTHLITHFPGNLTTRECFPC